MKNPSCVSNFPFRPPLRFTRREWLITGLTAGIAVLILVFRPPCLIKAVFGIPCPACGITRAWLSALHLQFAAAFRFHPMFWSVPILYLYCLRQCRVFHNPVINKLVLGLILAGWLVCYLFTLVAYFHPI